MKTYCCLKSRLKKKININTTFSFNGTVVADRNIINTVVRNLLSNAMKFTRHEGKIEISIHSDNDNKTISVKDNGVGISNEKCNKLFRIEFNNTTPGTNDETGTGIGLILCKEFVAKHKGKIWIDSTLGECSTFSFSIPIEL